MGLSVLMGLAQRDGEVEIIGSIAFDRDLAVATGRRAANHERASAVLLCFGLIARTRRLVLPAPPRLTAFWDTFGVPSEQIAESGAVVAARVLVQDCAGQAAGDAVNVAESKLRAVSRRKR